VSLTLLDMNPDLLNRATQRLSQSCAVEGILADVNELDLEGRRFDVILCVSGLHHVVELEHVFEEVAAGLRDDGEFWSIGETLGRYGGRMWPESYEVANAFFRRLPRKYRVNRMTGNVVDEDLGDMDYSIGCFEGIRCESIEPVLDRYLTPVDVCRHNCTLFKLFSPTYSDNYDTRSADDRALIEEAVDREIALFRQGGRPIELNGVYRRRQGPAG
jgi:SAM-dependent methyltransferase